MHKLLLLLGMIFLHNSPVNAQEKKYKIKDDGDFHWKYYFEPSWYCGGNYKGLT